MTLPMLCLHKCMPFFLGSFVLVVTPRTHIFRLFLLLFVFCFAAFLTVANTFCGISKLQICTASRR